MTMAVDALTAGALRDALGATTGNNTPLQPRTVRSMLRRGAGNPSPASTSVDCHRRISLGFEP